MKRPTKTLILVAAVALPLLLSGCRSEEEEARAAVLNFVVADRIHDAPYRSYLFISDEDQAAMTAEEYAAWHETHAPDGPEGAPKPRVNRLQLDGRRGNASVTLGEAEIPVVVRRDEDRWRVLLGLAPLAKIEGHIERAKTAREAGKLEEALEELEQADATPFPGTLAREMTDQIAALKSDVEGQVRIDRLERAFREARQLGLQDLSKRLPGLETQSGGGERWAADIDHLKSRLEALRKDAAVSGLSLEGPTIRLYYEDKRLAHDLEATVSNSSQLSVRNVVVEVEMMEDGAALGSREIRILEEALPPGATREIRVLIPDTPAEWRSRTAKTAITDLEVVDE